MTSDDRVIIELINSRFDTLEKYNAERFEIINGQLVQLRKDFDEMKAEVREVRYDVRMNEHDIAHLQTSVYWVFAALVVAASFAPTLLEMYKDRKRERRERAEYVTRSEMEEAITKALSMK